MVVVLALLASANVATAAVSSDNHAALKKALEQHPDADGDKNGVLSYAEYRDLLEKHPPKQADGRPAGDLSIVLPNGDLTIAEFEEDNLGRMTQWGWTIEGEVFNRDLKSGTQLMKRRAGSHHGKFLLTSFTISDNGVGTITSPGFEIQLNYIEFVMSGGDHPQRICVNLLMDETVVRTATARNDDLLETVAFDVSQFQGRQGRVQIMDAHRGLWGHINVDRIYQTNAPRAERIISEAPSHFGAAVGAILTRDARQHRGPLSIDGGALSINNDNIDLDSVLLSVFDHDSDSPGESGALTLINGETWRAKIVAFAKDEVTIDSTLFDQRQIPALQIASLDFMPGEAGSGEPGTLYRTRGEPIPGKLIWIRDKDIAIDCALGIVPLPRETVRRFVMSAVDPKAPRGADEIGLTDGSLFRGQLAIEDDKFVLTHAVLGPLNFASSAIRYIRRSPTDVTWFDRLEPAGLEQVGPVLPPPAPRAFEIDSGEQQQSHLRYVRMLPHTVARYALPKRENSKNTFRAQLSPVVGSRAEVVVKILADGRVVWQERLGANAPPTAIAADLGGAAELAIEVNFGEQLAFPCGVDFLDAHLMTAKN